MSIKFLANTSVSGKVYLTGTVVRFAAADEGNQVNLGNAVYWPAVAGVTPATTALVQSGIPFILPSTGTMGASGALSGITAIPVAYPDCYMYFPATAFAAASAAGWYYTVMSSTTAGTVYANTYSNGTPTIPTNVVAIVGAGSSYTQVTTLIAGPQFPMTAGQMGPNGILHVTYTEANNNSAGAKTFSTVLGATSVVANTATTTIGKSTTQRVYNAGKAAKQWTVADTTTGAVATASSTEDTATALTVSLSLQVAVATDTVQFSAYSISLLPS